MADKARLGAGTSADALPSADGRIECENVYKWFPGGIVLEDVSLTVEAGQFVCIVGPSGCGKSTLFNVIAGLLRPDSGEVLLSDQVVTGTTGHVGYMLQKDLLVPWRTVEDNITMAARLTRRNRDRKGQMELSDFLLLGAPDSAEASASLNSSSIA